VTRRIAAYFCSWNDPQHGTYELQPGAVVTRPAGLVVAGLLRDVLLLCSDGVSGVMEDAEIAAALVEHHDLDAAAATLLDRAKENGARDDLTCVLVRWTPRGAAAACGAMQ
jgi:hypothetical protein